MGSFFAISREKCDISRICVIIRDMSQVTIDDPNQAPDPKALQAQIDKLTADSAAATKALADAQAQAKALAESNAAYEKAKAEAEAKAKTELEANGKYKELYEKQVADAKAAQDKLAQLAAETAKTQALQAQIDSINASIKESNDADLKALTDIEQKQLKVFYPDFDKAEPAENQRRLKVFREALGKNAAQGSGLGAGNATQTGNAAALKEAMKSGNTMDVARAMLVK